MFGRRDGDILREVGRCVAVVALASALAAAAAASGGTWRVLAQTDVVGPEDVSTPAPPPFALPTPTPSVDAAAAQPTAAGQPPAAGETAGYVLGQWSASYVVREGDTLWTAALEMGLDLEVMPCVVDPFFRRDASLVIGDALASPAGELICHEASAGETLLSVASEHGVTPDALMADAWNGFRAGADINAALAPGRFVRIVMGVASAASPGFFAYMLERPIEEPPMLALARGGPVYGQGQAALAPDNWPYGSGYFDWPSPGWITQAYRNDHRAIDIAAPLGTTVTAADRGVVVRAGWNNQGYGMFVIIDHNIDYVTLYSHLDEIWVEEGDVVAQGQELGTVGSTGNSTGPHLHFEVRDFGSRINPLEVLVR